MFVCLWQIDEIKSKAMSLIKSISGIRGTIGGRPGEGLSPLDLVKFASAYGMWIKKNSGMKRPCVVLGRDARISGEMASQLVMGSLSGLGIDILHIGLATTPTTELAVVEAKAQGGIILTASHNPAEWNALKLLNEKGEFLNAAEGEEILRISEADDFNYVDVYSLGKIKEDFSFGQKHIQHVLNLDFVDVDAIRQANLKVAVDCVNSVGGLVLPPLLKALGVREVVELYCEPNGQFPHNPEPLAEHLTEISERVKQEQCDLGFVVDPDVDRLAVISEDGSMFGEEYTLVAVADYILQQQGGGNTVSNMSSSRALRDVTVKHGGEYLASAVGEVNVVAAMKDSGAVIGGEGNGGVIYPASHYGRDALVGIGLFLSHLAHKKQKVSELRASYPSCFMAKKKISLTENIDVDALLDQMKSKYAAQYQVSDVDGVKVDFPDEWVHLRKSNTEPIIRVYTEAPEQDRADRLADSIIQEIESLV